MECSDVEKTAPILRIEKFLYKMVWGCVRLSFLKAAHCAVPGVPRPNHRILVWNGIIKGVNVRGVCAV